MTKITSKLLTLMLSFAMVFTSIGWLGVSEVNAADGPTVLTIKVVDQNDQALEGVELGFDTDDASATLPATTAEGITSYDLKDAMKDNLYGFESSYELYLEDESVGTITEGVSFTLPEVEDPADLYFDTVNDEAYDGSTVTMVVETAETPEPAIDFVKMQAEDKTTWATYGIPYEQYDKNADFLLDVRQLANWKKGHLPGSTHVDVTLGEDLENGYVKAGSATAEKLDAAYEAAGSKRIVVLCNGGQTLAARAMQYLNASGKDMTNVTYIIDGAMNGVPASDLIEELDFVEIQATDAERWATFGIEYADMVPADFILDVRSASLFEAGHLMGAASADVTVADQVDENGYLKADSEAAAKLDAAYASAGEKRIVIICNSGNKLAARAMQYLNASGKDMTNVTYLIGGKGVIPPADLVVNAPDTVVERTVGAEHSRTMSVKIDMHKYDAGKVVRVWVPVPQTEDYQTIEGVRFSAKTADDARITESQGNKMLYLEWGKDAEPADRIAYLEFDATRAEAGHPELAVYDDTNFEYPADVAEYIDKTSQYVKIDGIVKEYADQITEGKLGTLAKVRAIYEWEIANLERIDNGETLTNASGQTQTFVVEGCGYGDTKTILSDLKNFGRAGGHCTDLNSTFVALCRASGIPAREMFGIRLGTDAKNDASGFQHCWAEFYLPGTGWVYADPGDVLKAIKPANKPSTIAEWDAARASDKCKERTEYFWGTVDNNRIVLSRGRDVTFEPAQAWGKCNTFGYPAAEIDGERIADFTDAKNFVYTITTNAAVDFIDMQKNDKDSWGTYGIEYADIADDDFILDVRNDAKYDGGHIAGSTHVDVTDTAQLDNGYVVADSDMAKALDKAYEDAAGRRIVIVCNTGNSLAARAMQYFNSSDKVMPTITYLIQGAEAIPAEDQVKTWSLENFVIEGTSINGLTDSGKARLKEDSVLELPEKNAEGEYITAIGAGSNNATTSEFGTFFAHDLDEEGKVTEVYVPTQVVLPSHLESIGNFAFAAAWKQFENEDSTKYNVQKGLTSIKFPKTLTTIGMAAFQNVPMEEVVIPDNVTSVGNGAFGGADRNTVKIKKVTLSANMSVVPQGAFASQGIEGKLVIPEGITEVGRTAFQGNPITEVQLPESLTLISRSAFQSTKLSAVVIPTNVTKIDRSAFSYTSTGDGSHGQISSVALNENLNEIGQDAFAGNMLTSVDLPASVKVLHKEAFADNTSVVRLISTVEDQVNATGDYTKVVTMGSGHIVNTKAGFAADDIANIPNVTEENIDEAAAATAAARAAYDALSDEEKAALPAGTVEKLEAAEAKVDALDTKAAAAKKIAATVALANEVVGAATVNTSPYKTKAVDAFKAAVENAKTVLSNEASTTEELNDAVAALSAAKDDLEKNLKDKNPLKVTGKNQTVKVKDVKKKAKVVKAITVKNNKGTVSYKKTKGSAKLTVNSKTGKITVKKGTKKGTYSITVKVTAKGNGDFKSGSKTKTIKIKVK